MKRMTCNVTSGIPRNRGRFLWFTPSNQTSTLSSRLIQSLDGHYWAYNAKHCYFVLLSSFLPICPSLEVQDGCAGAAVTSDDVALRTDLEDTTQRFKIFWKYFNWDFFFIIPYDYISKFSTLLGAVSYFHISPPQTLKHQTFSEVDTFYSQLHSEKKKV